MKTRDLLAALFTTWALSAPAQYALQFDHSRYDINPGQTFPVQVLISPVPPAGLFTFGAQITFSASNAVADGPASITVVPALDHDGMSPGGAVKATGKGYAAARGTVDFMTFPFQPYAGALLATVNLTDQGAGAYTLSLGLYGTGNPGEPTFFAGDGNGLDPLLAFATARVNYRPTVQLSAPTNGASGQAGSEWLLAAAASDPDGTVAQVQFWDGTNALGTATAPPFSFRCSGLETGTHTLLAVATDDAGAQATSAPVVVVVTNPPPPVPPVPPVPPTPPAAPAEVWAIFAGESNRAAGSKVLNFNGSSHVIRGKIHSNSDIDASGHGHSFLGGPVEYVTGVTPAPDFGSHATLVQAPLTLSSPKPYPVEYRLADFAPGGSIAAEAQAAGKYFLVSNDVQLASLRRGQELPEGLYYVRGDVHLSGVVRGKITLVAEGEIKLSCSGSTLESYTRCLLAFSAKPTARWNKPAIDLSGSSIRWQGVLFAPDGGISLSGADNGVLVGSLIGRGVTISGSGFQLAGMAGGNCPGLVSPLQPVWVGGSVCLVVPTVAGLSYAVETTASLANPAWETVATVQGDGTTKLVQPPSAPEQGLRFYRLRLVQ